MSKERRMYELYGNDMNRIAYWLVNNNKKFNTRPKYGYQGREADYATIIRVIKERGTNYQSDGLITEFVECAIVDNTDHSFLPNYVTGKDGKRFYKSTYVDMAKRCSLWEVEHNGQSPNFIWYETSTNTSASPSVVVGNVTKGISNATNTKISDYKSLYNAFYKGRYGLYYNDVYTQSQSLSRLKSRLPLNCTDLNQLAYYSLKEQGYNVRIVRGLIYCNKTYGHVWCQVFLNGKWVNFDASAAAKGKGLGSLICGSRFSVTNINPAWAVSDDGRT